MGYLERIHVEYSSLFSLLTHSLDLSVSFSHSISFTCSFSHSRSHSLRSLPLRFSFAFLPCFPMDSRINDDYAQLTVNRYLPHGKQLYTARGKWKSEWKLPPNGMKRTMLLESKWAKHAIECDMFCTVFIGFVHLLAVSVLLFSSQRNIFTIIIAWPITVGAFFWVHWIVLRTDYIILFIHSSFFLFSSSCFFQFFRFTCLSCHSGGWL